MTNTTPSTTEERFAAVEEYANALRNWDAVHKGGVSHEVDRDEENAAWSRREVAFAELKRIEAELVAER